MVSDPRAREDTFRMLGMQAADMGKSSFQELWGQGQEPISDHFLLGGIHHLMNDPLYVGDVPEHANRIQNPDARKKVLQDWYFMSSDDPVYGQILLERQIQWERDNPELAQSIRADDV
jgi:hypothetical protein